MDYWHCFIVSFHGKHGFSIQKVMHLSPPSTNQPTLTVPEYMDGINLVSLRKKTKKKPKEKTQLLTYYQSPETAPHLSFHLTQQSF